MARLEGLLRRGLPVPVGRVPNRRSFLFLDNLVSVIQAYLMHPDPPTGRAWMVADEDVVSTETLVRRCSKITWSFRPKARHKEP